MATSDFRPGKFSIIGFLAALLIFILSLASNNADSDTDRIASKTARRIEKRLAILDRHISTALETLPDEFITFQELPDDMVIYRYVNDSLQSWCNQFTVSNDGISSRFVTPTLNNSRNILATPLADIGSEISYVNFGPKWYVVKSAYGENNEKIVAGLEIKNNIIDDMYRNKNGVNPELGLSNRYSVMSIDNSGGSTVSISGIPLFKIIYETVQLSPFFDNSLLKWIALALFGIATIFMLAGHRTFKAYGGTIMTLVILFCTSYIWGVQMSGTSDMFSPTIYADGNFFSSLGALLITNTLITGICICNYLIRNRVKSFILNSRKPELLMRLNYIAVSAMIAVLVLYVHLTFKSLSLNSNITMGLHRWSSISIHLILSYISYTGLMFCILLYMQELKPLIRRLTGLHINFFSTRALITFAIICTSYFTISSAAFGFQKEKDRVMVWANRLAVERDLGLEIQLKNVERSISSDQFMLPLAILDGTGELVKNRITEYYLSRRRQTHHIDAVVIHSHDRTGISQFNAAMHAGTPISEGSCFNFVTDGNGHSHYCGTFTFYSSQEGVIRLILKIEPLSNREDRGYYSIIGRISRPGEISIPSAYSYARYTHDRLVSYKGSYPYPTLFGHVDQGSLNEKKNEILRLNGHIHFIHLISDDELVIISRPKRSPTLVFTSFSYLFFIIFAVISITSRSRKKRRFKSNYFKTRINSILFISTLLTLVIMTIISVTFVYKRNETNMMDIMSSKITTIQALIETRVHKAESYQDLSNREFVTALENISNTTKSDITMFTPDGMVFRSTTPEIFEKVIIGNRIDQNAYFNIKYQNQRFYIHQENFAENRYWSMYAPVFNGEGKMIAIINTPYTEGDYDFRQEAITHAAFIVNLFIILLIVSLLFSTREVDSMFSPLVEMGRKMNKAEINNLEYIIYKREDEISSLVDAYNRMVHALSDSTRQLAQAERDKAWSQMARQVAHEIKNPLTPIKLEIQRLIRLKQNNNPTWEDKFDKVADVVLEHIDILTDTANEFSTFAKLYSETPVLIDLDKTLKEQLMLFENREDIQISYLGMENAFVMAPRPQLIRVFVNLITNAVQAVEMNQNTEGAMDGKAKGRIMICLRNSTQEGYLDIAFDDNGPGVKEENLGRLFTPNFTTKSGGTGLGLAICRNIIEKCEGDIRYRKSFTLGGASFVVTLPRHKA